MSAMTLNRTKYLGQLAVGRLRNNATGFRPLAGPLNLTVWESVEALEWFEKLDIPHFVMWWVPAGHRPTVKTLLQARRPSLHGFRGIVQLALLRSRRAGGEKSPEILLVGPVVGCKCSPFGFRR